jgi:type II secretory pathway pseudopilin PulG
MRQGFALLEFLIVIALCVLMASLVMSGSALFDQLLVRMEMDTLYTRILALQHRARLTNTDQALIFDVDANSYHDDTRLHHLTPPVCFGFPSAVKGPPSQPNAQLKSAVTFPENRIVVKPDGDVMSSGSVYLTDKNRQCLYALTISVAQVSYVRCYIYENGWARL